MRFGQSAYSRLEPLLAYLGRRWGYHRGVRIFSALRARSVKFHHGREDRLITIRDYDGDLHMRVDRSTYIGSLIYWHGGQPTHELKLLRHLLRPEMVMVDVGANQGEVTLVAAKRLPEGAVITMEPLPALFAQLKTNLALNGFRNVVALDCALAAEAGQRAMYTSMDDEIHRAWNEGLASLYRSGFRDTLVGTVAVETLDAVVDRLGLGRLDVIKIDVEGAEAQVLRGGLASLQKFKPAIVMEINPSALTSAGSSTKELADLITPIGYRFNLIRRAGHVSAVEINELTDNCDVLCRVD